MRRIYCEFTGIYLGFFFQVGGEWISENRAGVKHKHPSSWIAMDYLKKQTAA